MIPSLNQSAGVIVCYGLVNTSNLINEVHMLAFLEQSQTTYYRRS
jgi:hypothetical protein